jgi:hypothetical protein
MPTKASASRDNWEMAGARPAYAQDGAVPGRAHLTAQQG